MAKVQSFIEQEFLKIANAQRRADCDAYLIPPHKLREAIEAVFNYGSEMGFHKGLWMERPKIAPRENRTFFHIGTVTIADNENTNSHNQKEVSDE